MPKVYNKRDKNIPAGAVYVGRPTIWGNPYAIGNEFAGKILNREDVILLYRKHLERTPLLLRELPKLKGKDLVCWCAPKPCHADVLLELANRK